MSQPLVFISRHKVKEGQLDELKKSFDENVPVLQSEKPGTVLFYAYLNQAETEIRFVHVFPDAEAMDAHLVGAAERSADSMRFLQPVSFRVFGKPSEQALEMLRESSESGAELTIIPNPVGGFIRLSD